MLCTLLLLNRMTVLSLLAKRQKAAKAALLVVLFASGAAASGAVASRFDKTPQHTSKLTGQQWMEELFEGHDRRFYNQMGMEKHVFRQLIKVLQEKAGLGDTKHVTIEEQLGIFLYMAVTGNSNRKMQERFQRSGDTISKCVFQAGAFDST
jgi:hypothetical protein